MVNKDTYKKTLDNFSEQRYQRAIDILSDRGFITDEDIPFGSPTMEHASKMIIDRLRAKGYPHELNNTGFFFDGYGAVYASYNNDDFENEFVFINQAVRPHIENSTFAAQIW